MMAENSTDERFQAHLCQNMGDERQYQKGKIIAFQPQGAVPEYTIDNVELEHMDHCEYLGVMLQSDLKFSNHIADKFSSSGWQDLDD